MKWPLLAAAVLGIGAWLGLGAPGLASPVDIAGRDGGASPREGHVVAVTTRGFATSSPPRGAVAPLTFDGGSPPADVPGLAPPSAEELARSVPYTCFSPDAGPECGQCRTNSDCQGGEACGFDPASHQRRCLRSDCETDYDCRGTDVCRVVNDVRLGPALRRCVPTGSALEGSACQNIGAPPERTCSTDLLCLLGRCARTCDPKRPNSCPSGSSCIKTNAGWGCSPSCKATGCPAGQTCANLGGTLSACAVQRGENCFDHPCPDGQECTFQLSAGIAAFTCRQTCNPARVDSCPGYHVCGLSGTRNVCFQRCRPMEAPCPEGQYCGVVEPEQGLMGCVPYLRRTAEAASVQGGGAQP